MSESFAPVQLPDGYGTVFPYMFVQDAAKFLEFLVHAFAAVEIERVLAASGRIANAQIQIGTTRFMVSEAPAEFPAMPASYYVFVASADAACEQACQAGAVKIMDVEDRPYGDRQGGVRDPFGNIWWISQRLSPGPYC